MARIVPGETLTDELHLQLINDTRWSLQSQDDEVHPWRLIIVYRGLHCPLCKEQLICVRDRLQDFSSNGISVVAASMDRQERALTTQDEWSTGALPIAFGLNESFADQFGLYVSEALSENEPDVFLEPALLLFRGNTFHAAWIQSLPFARPEIGNILESIGFMSEEDYPPRGTLK